MPIIISEIQFTSRAEKLLERYEFLREKFPDDLDFKKLKRVFKTLKVLYTKDKVYAVKQLNFLEQRQILFSEERRALCVKVIELLQKLILHKKLQKNE